MDTRIPQLPYIPGAINPAAAFLEVAYPDVSSATGYTSTRAYVNDILGLVPSPSIGLNEIAYGDQFTGALTSNNLLVRNPSSGYMGVNTTNPQAQIESRATLGSFAYKAQSDAGHDSVFTWDTAGNISDRHKMYLENSTQTMNFYTKNNDTIFWNGNGLAQVKTLSMYYNTAAQFHNAVGINVNPIGAARLEIIGGGMQGAYVQTSNSIGINSNDPTGIANKAETATGTSFRANVTNASGIALDLYNTNSTTQLLKVIGSGYAGFRTTSPAYPIDLMGWYGVNSEQISFFTGYNIGMAGTTIYNRNPQPSGQPFRWQTDGVDGIGMSSSVGGNMGLHIGNNALGAQGGILTVGHTGTTTNIVNLYNAVSGSVYRLLQSGYQVTKALDAVFPDASLGNSEMTHYIDEATDQLIFKVKYSTGVVKTANLLLI